MATNALARTGPERAPQRGRPAQARGHELDIPALGEDTEPLLHELGYTDADIAQFRRDRVI